MPSFNPTYRFPAFNDPNAAGNQLRSFFQGLSGVPAEQRGLENIDVIDTVELSSGTLSSAQISAETHADGTTTASPVWAASRHALVFCDPLRDDPAQSKVRRETPSFESKVETLHANGITSWQDLGLLIEELRNRELNSSGDLKILIQDYYSLCEVYYEAHAWAQIDVSRDTRNLDYKTRFDFFRKEIGPQWAEQTNLIDEKINSSPYLSGLPSEFDNFREALELELKKFRSENIPLITELGQLRSQYDAINGAMTVEWEGQNLNLAQAAKLLQTDDIQRAEAVWEKTQGAVFSGKAQIDAIYSRMVELRTLIARNAGYRNFVEYHFDGSNYTPAQSQALRDAIAEHVVPICREIERWRLERLNVPVGQSRPWDALLLVPGEKALKPFENTDELIAKMAAVFERISPEMGQMVRDFANDPDKLFDIEARLGKKSGGYNMSLSRSRKFFIFMNVSPTQAAVRTLAHELGHGWHNHKMRELSLKDLGTPPEMSEVASMFAELVTMAHWDEFYSDPNDLKRAQFQQLSGALGALPWMAVVDEMQFWAYENPEHTPEQREEHFNTLLKKYGLADVNYGAYEKYRYNRWLTQGHPYWSPFYYLQYAISQMASLELYRRYLENPEGTLEAYDKGLALGGSVKVPEVFNQMGLNFEAIFSAPLVEGIASFVRPLLQEQRAALVGNKKAEG